MKIYKTFFLLAYFSTKSFETPVENGQNVGTLEVLGNSGFVTGHKQFPFIAHLAIETIRYRNKETNWCTGVIIGKRAVLTAAHCVHGKFKPKVIVHVGILETKWEKNGGQKVISIENTPHKLFRPQCAVGQRCCYAANDLAILWLEQDLNFGAHVKQATLTKDENKPFDKEGWILGWGKTTNGIPTMLQKGLMKVVSTRKCERHNPRLYITQNVICLAGANQGTKSGAGDSGGPFVIDDVVYGISSFAAHETCQTIDVYTFVAKYTHWIESTLAEGPPSKKPTTIKPKKVGKHEHVHKKH